MAMSNWTKTTIWLTVLLGLVAPITGWAEWNRETVGSGMGWASALACGPARNDGTNRIYAAGWTRLYEFTWNGSSWESLDMGVTSGWGVALGEGRNDGQVRVYATYTVVGPQRGGVYEYDWNGSSWVRTTVATFPSTPSSSAGHAVALGPGQNDDTVRVYSCDCNNDRTFESTWTGSSWSTVQIFNWSSTDLVVAPGRGDGVYRLYCSHQGSPLREYSWTGSTWTFVELDTAFSSYYDVSVGVGRNDGVIRVYSGSSLTPRSLYEFTWTGSAWEKARLGGMPNLPRCVAVGPGRNDGVNRVYSGTTGGSRYALEYTWNGTDWDSSWVDSTGGSRSYQDALVGDGRSDGVQRLYMASSDEYVYEFTYLPPGVAEELTRCQMPVARCQLLQNYPNPFSHTTNIQFSISNFQFPVSLRVYDLSGRLVRTLLSHPSNYPTIQLSNQVIWDGRDEEGRRLSSGVYFLRLTIDGFAVTKTAVLVR